MSAKGIAEDDRERLIEALRGDPSLVVGLDEADRRMLSYALKLTRTPGAMTVADVEGLRDGGFDDRGIHDICAITSYFAFVNRIADGLGVELESPR